MADRGQWCERCRQAVEQVWIVRFDGMSTGTYTICRKCRLMLEKAGLIRRPFQEWEYRYYDYCDVFPLRERHEYQVVKEG